MTSTVAGVDAGTDGTPAETSTPAPFACRDCLPVDVRWGWNGGLAAYTESSVLAACRTYTHQRSDSASACSLDLGACAAVPIAVGDVEKALSHPDVVAALAGATQLYGSDPRGCDGAVMDVTVGAKTIEVGGDCSSGISCGAPGASCVPVPAGVKALVDLLGSLDTQELATDACKAVFP